MKPYAYIYLNFTLFRRKLWSNKSDAIDIPLTANIIGTATENIFRRFSTS